MIVTFKEQGHLYESIPAQSWTSVTRVIEKFCPEFNDKEQAIRSSQNSSSKWYGMEPKKILSLWEKERNRSVDVGHRFHSKMESKAIKLGSKKHRGKVIKVIPTPFIDGVKTAQGQVLADGVYPEHIVFNERIGVCGQSDLVFVVDGYVDISDYKTNKEMIFNSYKPTFGSPKMTLQLSIYLKLILMKNTALKPGKLTLIHVLFELEGQDPYGFPIIKTENGIEVVKEIVHYEVPFLEKEAVLCLKKIMSLRSMD
jgi:hypothetical protein